MVRVSQKCQQVNVPEWDNMMMWQIWLSLQIPIST